MICLTDLHPHSPLPQKEENHDEKKIQAKVIQGYVLWQNFKKKILTIFFHNNYADKRWNPLVHLHAAGSKHRHPCTQSAWGVPKSFTPLIQYHCGLAHLASILSLDITVMVKSFIFILLKTPEKVLKQQQHQQQKQTKKRKRKKKAVVFLNFYSDNLTRKLFHVV